MTKYEMSERERRMVLTVLRSSARWREWSLSLTREDVAERVRSYVVEDGVIAIPGSSWVGVIDPSAPGSLKVGDIVAWGSRDKRGRKEGPFYRLVYFVSDTEVRCLAVDY